ncbi:MAG: squalene synthase [Bacteroidetes bacterium]|nr:squalene synthase [Bacteroidota bacterium]
MVGDLLKSAHKPFEILAMLKVKFGDYAIKSNEEPLDVLALKQGDRDFCYSALNEVSRSFAIVIQQLPKELRDPVCIFYLVLRGLDSVEDDMTYPAEKRLALLREFYVKCDESGWKIEGVGDSKNYRILLSNFDKIIRVLKSLDKGYRDVILDICRKMGEGMADYAERKVVTLDDYDEYCYYVAGLVGIGLSSLFSASGLESDELKERTELSNSMGLLLQKTNISRDYYEDLSLGRAFWPKEIWGKYTSRLEELAKNPTSIESLACINELVTDALQYVSNCVVYLHMLRDPQIFRFCAIPQVMALATLAKIYNNPDVYTEVVKIRKGLAAKMMVYTNSMEVVHRTINTFVLEIEKKLDKQDPNHDKTQFLLEEIKKSLDAVRYSPRHIPPRKTIEETVLF